jgi:hypothetical protein
VALNDERRAKLAADIARLRRHVSVVAEIDFFSAPGRLPVEASIGALEQRLREAESAPTKAADEAPATESYRGRVWVTRKGIHVDRLASAWLIRRFIDPDATFRFVVAKDHRHSPGELRFDMFDAEFTHEGESCSFEVLAARLGVRDPAVRAIGEVVHDLDLKDERFGRAETAGVNASIAGICWAHASDEARLAAGQVLFDALYEFFRRRPSG